VDLIETMGQVFVKGREKFGLLGKDEESGREKNDTQKVEAWCRRGRRVRVSFTELTERLNTQIISTFAGGLGGVNWIPWKK